MQLLLIYGGNSRAIEGIYLVEKEKKRRWRRRRRRTLPIAACSDQEERKTAWPGLQLRLVAGQNNREGRDGRTICGFALTAGLVAMPNGGVLDRISLTLDGSELRMVSNGDFKGNRVCK